MFRSATLAAVFVLSVPACSDSSKKLPIGSSCSAPAECESGICGGGLCLDPAEDFDNDGLFNGIEASLGTDPANADTDGDGVNDGAEIGEGLDQPADSDQDGRIDAVESAIADCDGDEVPDQDDPDDGLDTKGQCGDLQEPKPTTDAGGPTADAGAPPDPIAYEGNTPHLRMRAVRGDEQIDTTRFGEELTITCTNDGDTTRMDVEYVGDITELLGNVTLKFKDGDLAVSSVPTVVETRFEWELKDKQDVTLCDQAATRAIVTIESAVDQAGVGVLGGTVEALMGAGEPLATDPCPEADVEISFAAQCGG